MQFSYRLSEMAINWIVLERDRRRMPRNERGERWTMIDTGYTGRKATELWRDTLTSGVNYSVLRSVIGFPRAEELKAHTERIPLRKLLFFPDDDYVFCFQTTCYANYFLRIQLVSTVYIQNEKYLSIVNKWKERRFRCSQN